MKNPVITIARQYGSEGHTIGEQLAKRLGVPFYDKELIDLAAQKSGYHPDALKRADEKAAGSLLYTLATGATSLGSMIGHYDIPINDKLFIVQNDVIKELAEKEQCVIIGRCGDYALRNFENKVTVFICGDVETRVKHICDTLGVTKDAAESMIAKEDKRRASYYNFYTGQKWGVPDRYTLCLNSSVLGVEGCVDVIADVVARLSRD
jgi:cytidylate kinase